jgi:hypothetical protein
MSGQPSPINTSPHDTPPRYPQASHSTPHNLCAFATSRSFHLVGSTPLARHGQRSLPVPVPRRRPRRGGAAGVLGRVGEDGRRAAARHRRGRRGGAPRPAPRLRGRLLLRRPAGPGAAAGGAARGRADLLRAPRGALLLPPGAHRRDARQALAVPRGEGAPRRRRGVPVRVRHGRRRRAAHQDPARVHREGDHVARRRRRQVRRRGAAVQHAGAEEALHAARGGAGGAAVVAGARDHFGGREEEEDAVAGEADRAGQGFFKIGDIRACQPMDGFQDRLGI